MSRYNNELFAKALQQEGFSGELAQLAWNIYAQESGSGTNTSTSHAGARGGMQIIPSTFKSVADKGWDINNPEHNVRAGLRYLKQMYDYGGEDLRMAAIGYYGGPGGINKAKKGIAVRDPRPEGINFPDTFQYANNVVPSSEGIKATPAAPSPIDSTPEVPFLAQPESGPAQADMNAWTHSQQAGQEVPPEWEAFRNWIPRRDEPVRDPRQSVNPLASGGVRQANFSDALRAAESMMAQNRGVLQNGWEAMRGWV